jgi:hypothetical protein
MTDKKITVEFAPGCFDDFDGTQEELDELMKTIQQGFESGDFLEQSAELTEEMFLEMPEEDQQLLIAALDRDCDSKRSLQ